MILREFPVIFELYNRIPNILKSYLNNENRNFDNFLHYAKDLYRNLPNNLGIINFYAKDDNKTKDEIDENFNFFTDLVQYPEVIMIGTKMFNLHTVTFKEIADYWASTQGDPEISTYLHILELSKAIEKHEISKFRALTNIKSRFFVHSTLDFNLSIDLLRENHNLEYILKYFNDFKTRISNVVSKYPKFCIENSDCENKDIRQIKVYFDFVCDPSQINTHDLNSKSVSTLEA